MTEQTADASFGKSAKEFWHALLLIVPITLRWIWMLITSVNQPQVKKSEMIWDMLSDNMDTYAQNEGLKRFEVRRDEKLKKYLQGSDIVLDYGCGTGTIAIKFADTVKLDFIHLTLCKTNLGFLLQIHPKNCCFHLKISDIWQF